MELLTRFFMLCLLLFRDICFNITFFHTMSNVDFFFTSFHSRIKKKTQHRKYRQKRSDSSYEEKKNSPRKRRNEFLNGRSKKSVEQNCLRDMRSEKNVYLILHITIFFSPCVSSSSQCTFNKKKYFSLRWLLAEAVKISQKEFLTQRVKALREKSMDEKIYNVCTHILQAFMLKREDNAMK